MGASCLAPHPRAMERKRTPRLTHRRRCEITPRPAQIRVHGVVLVFRRPGFGAAQVTPRAHAVTRSLPAPRHGDLLGDVRRPEGLHAQTAGLDPRGARAHGRGCHRRAVGGARPGERDARRNRPASDGSAPRGARRPPGGAGRRERETTGDTRGRAREGARRGGGGPGEARRGNRRGAFRAREETRAQPRRRSPPVALGRRIA